MNEKVCKSLRKIAQLQTVGRTPAFTRKVYRKLKKVAKQNGT